MTTAIAESIAASLYRARLYLWHNAPIETMLTPGELDALVILFSCECAVRLENSQN